MKKGLFLVLVVFAVVGCQSETAPGKVEPAPPASAEPADTMGAPDASPGRTTRFCDPSVPDRGARLFCSDFEGERPFGDWLNAEKQPNPGELGGGKISAFDTGAPARATVARCVSPALLDANDRSTAFLASRLEGLPPRFEVTFTGHIERDLASTGDGLTRLLMLSFGTDLGYIGIERGAGKTEAFVAERVDGKLKGKYAPLDHSAWLSGWASLVVRVENAPVDGGNGRVTVSLGDASQTIALPASFQQVAGPLALSVGIATAIGPLDGFAIDIDDVAVTASQ